ncbi:MAG: 50S ribosomal protein L25/general stress protein Ctc [Rhodovibrionaceae bacterium]
MTEIHRLEGEARTRSGKGAARADRRNGRVPAIVYGASKDPSPITLAENEVKRELNTGSFYSTLYDLEVEGDKVRVLPRDVQFHPVTDRPEHIDFLRVSARTKVHVNVPVHFINEDQSPGLERGGVLNVVRHEVEFYCRADAIPSYIEVDLAGFEIGDGAHISGVKLPEGVEPSITDRDFTIATIAAPTILTAEEEAEDAEGEEDEAAEGEEDAEGEESAEGDEDSSGDEGEEEK